MERCGALLGRKLMENREEKQEKRESGRMRVAAEENRRREESQRSDETGRETHKWSEREERRDAISRPYLLIMSLYFKVQSVPVMLLHDCAPGEFPHRSDDKRMPDSRVCGAPTHSVLHILG